jgi:GMP synthase (glutamine-hydrolysing)
MPAPILLVLHQEHSTPGRVAQILKSRGHSFDIRRPRFGDPLPETLEHHAGAVIFGGPNSANDEEDFVRREIEWLKVPLREEKPFLGICLGAQFLARHLGSNVYCHRDGQVEVGYYPIRPTSAAHFEGRAAYDYAIRAWLQAFLERWAGQAASVPETRLAVNTSNRRTDANLRR